MIGLGKQVLQKIQNLLVQIEKNDNKKIKNNLVKQILKVSQNNKSSNQMQKKKQQKTKQTKPNKQNKENKQNICSQRLENLYLNHFIKQEKKFHKKVDDITEINKSLKPFKVENKISQFINQKRCLKPIYQRTNQILLKRQRSIQKIRQTRPKKKQQLQQQQIQLVEQIRRQKYPRYSRQQFQRKMEEIQMKSIMRVQKLQKQKLAILQEKQRQILQKPQISQTTNKYWNKKKLQKNLSTNVLERFQQYDFQKKIKWQNYLDQRKKQETPFTPRLNNISKQLTKRNTSRGKLRICEKMGKSLSCHVFMKDDDLISSRNQNQTYRKASVQQSQRDKSIQRSSKQRKSITTADSSKVQFNNSLWAFSQKKVF